MAHSSLELRYIVSSEGYVGTQGPESRANEFNAVEFVITQLLNKRNYTTMVQVMAVRSAGEVAPVGFVDVQIMLNQIDAAGNSMPHGIVNNVPYFRLQGGRNAVIIDPQVGDIGMATFADRDISSVKATRAISNPGSKRRADIADGLYTGGFLNGVPTQYIRFTDSGIEVVSPNNVTVRAPSINMIGTDSVTLQSASIVLDGPVTGTAGAVFTGDVTGQGTSLHTHKHGGVQSGGAQTGVPV